MEKQPSINVGANLLAEFIDDALEGVDPRPPADQSEIVKTHLLDEFVDDAAAFPVPPSQSMAPESDAVA
ncbi:MAG TPA: hypothetical protein DDY78_17425 [Planctomycetales bacterium]|jgi:hypothetical protein|nr:hypothetical protein [Planctomycetales bacterium]